VERREWSFCASAYTCLLRTPLRRLPPPLPSSPCLLPSVLPKAEVTANPFLVLAATRRGGHLGFLQGSWPLGVSYADAAVDDWLAAALSLAGEEGAAAFSWEERAAALGWAPPEGRGDAASVMAAARCDCLARNYPGLAASRAAADAAAADAAAAAAAASKASAAGGGSGGDKRWRLEDVLKGAPAAPESRGLGLLGVWTSLAGMAGRRGAPAATDGRDAGDSVARASRAVAVPSATLEVLSPTLERRPRTAAVGSGAAAAAAPPRSKL
jgi:hypothetical protein